MLPSGMNIATFCNSQVGSVGREVSIGMSTSVRRAHIKKILYPGCWNPGVVGYWSMAESVCGRRIGSDIGSEIGSGGGGVVGSDIDVEICLIGGCVVSSSNGGEVGSGGGCVVGSSGSGGSSK